MGTKLILESVAIVPKPTRGFICRDCFKKKKGMSPTRWHTRNIKP